MQKLNLANKKQKGAVLIIFAVILVLAATAYFIKIIDPVALQAARDDKNAQYLAQAKRALISHSISRASAGERPGDMPRPDYFATTEAPNFNYDGDTDSGCLNAAAAIGLPLINNGINMRCLGRLPWRTIGMSIPSPTQNDVIGSMPWYAVSANLVDSTCLTVLNSDILNLVNIPPPSALDCSGATLPHPWLTVRDSNGNLISDRVAVVIIIPNAPLTGQARPSLPLNGTTAYLETIAIPAVCAAPCIPGNYSNADFDNSFILHDNKNVTTINDKLVFITIDELMSEVERRATQEAARQVNIYYTNSNAIPANRFFPYAAALGVVNNVCQEGNIEGFVPVRPSSASCTSTTSCNVSFPMTEVEFELTSGNYTNRTGFCSRAANICTCNGVGSCNKSSAPASSFSCNAAGLCQSIGTNPDGVFTFNYTAKTPDVSAVFGACVINAIGQVICNNVGSFSSPPTTCTHANPGLAALPDWFTDNNWQNFIYYAISNNCSAATPGCVAANLTVGTRNNVHAVLISSGVALASTEAQPAIPQVRPSVNFANYLDGSITDGSIIFDATSKMEANDYNDQPLIVAP